MHAPETYDYEKFQSHRSGQICSNAEVKRLENELLSLMFQSPRSGQICSNHLSFYQQSCGQQRFNPLDRVKFVQIRNVHDSREAPKTFQSPRSGQICLNLPTILWMVTGEGKAFQSPRSGQICLNAFQEFATSDDIDFCFNPLDRVKFV